jgi:hypothetical protein
LPERLRNAVVWVVSADEIARWAPIMKVMRLKLD